MGNAQHRKNWRRQWGKAPRKLWFLWDPPGMVIAGFAWCIMGASLLALWTSISRWFGLFSPAGLLAALWFSALMGMCMWSHFAVVTTNPGTVPAKLTGVAASKKQEVLAGAVDQEEEEEDEEDFEEIEVEIPLTELESQEDDGSLLLFCDECAIYRPSRYARWLAFVWITPTLHYDDARHSLCVFVLPEPSTAAPVRTASCYMITTDLWEESLNDSANARVSPNSPWVNNCVGIGNQKSFLLLLMYVTVMGVHVALFIAAQAAFCHSSSASATIAAATCGFGDDALYPGRLGVWILTGACVFGLFCSIMFAMELYSICLEPVFTLIADQITCRSGSKSRSRLERHLSVVCGTNGFEPSWLLPVAPRRTRHEIAIVNGFRTEDDDYDRKADATC